MPAEATDHGRSAPSLGEFPAVTLRMARVNTASRQARDFARTELTDLDDSTLQTVLLVATELVTNAVLHAEAPIDLAFVPTPEAVLVTVTDCEPLHPELRPHDVDRTNGRGIALVSMVSRDWGSKLHDGGKTVWALIERPTQPAS